MNESKNFTYQTRFTIKELGISILDSYAKLHGSVERHLFEDLNKSLTVGSLKSEYLINHGITARQFNAVRVSVEGKMAAAKACRIEHVEQLKEKVSSLEKKLFKIKNKKTRHQKNRSLASMKIRLEQLKSAHKKGPVSICFGGEEAFSCTASFSRKWL